jgi:hypothetical protein
MEMKISMQTATRFETGYGQIIIGYNIVAKYDNLNCFVCITFYVTYVGM